VHGRAYYLTLSIGSYRDKLCLLQAEFASLRGRNVEAYSKYVCGMAMSKDSGFSFVTGLVNEHAGRHFVRLGDRDKALPYFREACHYYSEWGGLAKVRALENEMQTLFPRWYT